MFRRHKIPFLYRRPNSLGSEAREAGVSYIEWSAILVALSVFSPQGTKRHMLLLLLVHLLAAMMLWLPRSSVPRGTVLAAVLFAQAGLRLPAKEVSLAATTVWNHIGGPSWCLLLFLLCMVRSSLAYWRDVHQESAGHAHAPSSRQVKAEDPREAVAPRGSEDSRRKAA
jgi:hypothetical protein